MTNPTSNFGWQMPEPTDLVTNLPADFEVFGQAVDTDFVDLLGGTTGQVLSKTSNTDLDFTWAAPTAGDITGVTAGTGISGGGTSGAVTVTNDMATTITAAGDIVVGTGSGTYDNLPIGTTDQILTADTTVSPYKVKWAAPAAGGGLTLISETVASSLSSLSFTSLGSYKQLLLMYFGILSSDNTSVFSIRFNNSSSTIYRGAGIQFRQATGESYAYSKNSLQGEANGQQIYSWGDGANAGGNNDTTSVHGRILIDNYTSSTKAKQVDWKVNYYANGLGQYHALNVNHFFDSTTAITSIDVVRLAGAGTFSNSGNSTIRLYGVN